MKLRFVFAALALAACSPAAPASKAEPSAEDKVRAEFAKIEADKTAMGDLLSAMREGQPDLYEQFIEIASGEVEKGKAPFEAGAAARPVYMARFLELVMTAGDDDINEMLEYTKLQMQHLIDMDPVLCAKAVNGESDQRMMKLPRDVLEREMRLMARVLRAGDQGGEPADEDEVFEWVDDYLSSHPEMEEGLELMGASGLPKEDARKVCMANMILLEGLLQEPPEVRAPLFRALLAAS
jgi:hypothetical protein